MGVLLSEQKSFKSLQIEQLFDRFDWICQISRQSRLHQAIITIQSYLLPIIYYLRKKQESALHLKD